MKSKFIMLFVLMIIPLTIFAQDATTTQSAPTEITQTPQTQQSALDFLNTLDAPKIIKNNIRIKNLQITKAEVNSQDELVIEGTVDINNYGTTRSSNLYMNSFTGIKGERGYYLQYPFYNQSRTEAFVIEPQQTITKNFIITEKNFVNYGVAAVEVWVVDEYDNRSHATIGFIPNQILAQDVRTGGLFVDFVAQLQVGDQSFVPSNGPTFYPEKENMYIKFLFEESIPSFMTSAHIKVYERNFFTPVIKEFDYALTAEEIGSGEITIEVPKDLAPGVYPFEVTFDSSDPSIFVPRTYGRFIVGGNMGKVNDVTLVTENKLVKGLILVVQGNPQDITDFDGEHLTTFDAVVTVLDKKNNILFTQKIEKQTVAFYRNIDINLVENLKIKDIYKIKVELHDEKGIFDSYEKEFEHQENFIFAKILSLLGILVLIALILKFKKKKETFPIVCFLFSIMSLVNFTSVEAGMTPTPYNHFGAFIYDGYAVESVPENNINCTGTCSGPDSIVPLLDKDDTDIARFDGDSLLTSFQINIALEEPVTVAVDPTYCYAPGQVIPVVFIYEYGICSNSPTTTCTGSYCGTQGATTTTSIDDYADIFLSVDPGDWSWSLRDWEYDTTKINDPDTYYDTVSSLDNDSYKQFDLDYLYDFVGELSNQSTADFLYESNGTKANNLQTVNMNEDNITNTIPLLLEPTTSLFGEIPINVIGFTATGEFDYSIVAPEKPGIYNFYTTMRFDAKHGGTGYYVAEHKINVCDTKHDADYILPGKQYVDSAGTLRNEDGSALSGYMIQKYPITYGIINGDGTYVDGSNDNPYNEFDFVTVGNYCGYKDTSIGAVDPDFLTESWINYFTDATDIGQKSGWQALSEFLMNIPDTGGKTKIPVSGFYYDGTRYFATYGTSSPSYLSLNSYASDYDYIVQYEGGQFMFVNLLDSFLPQNNGFVISPALKLDDLVNVPKLTFAQMLSSGRFNFIANLSGNKTIISSSTNDVSNTYLIKENLTYGSSQTTCALYEDFCPSVGGIQYLIQYGTSMRLMTIGINGVHNFASSTAYNAAKATVDGMCGAVTATTTTYTLGATCAVESPASSADRIPNTPIVFHATVTGANPANSTTYSWTSATAQTDTTRANKTYTTTGSKTDVSVLVTNGTSTVNVSCPVTIASAPTINAYCTGSSVEEGESSTYTAYPSGATSYQWKDQNGSNISAPTSNSQVFTPTYGVGSYSRQVQVVKDGITEVTAMCVSSVYPVSGLDTPILTHFRFKPHVAPPTINSCNIELAMDNIVSCTVGPTSIPATSGSISIVSTDGITAPVGTHKLMCTGLGVGATPIEYGIPQKCISNPDSKED